MVVQTGLMVRTMLVSWTEVGGDGGAPSPSIGKSGHVKSLLPSVTCKCRFLRITGTKRKMQGDSSSSSWGLQGFSYGFCNGHLTRKQCFGSQPPVCGRVQDPPAGTGITTFFFCLACPAPLHTTQGDVMMVPRPPHLRHVERITKGPVFMVS